MPRPMSLTTVPTRGGGPTPKGMSAHRPDRCGELSSGWPGGCGRGRGEVARWARRRFFGTNGFGRSHPEKGFTRKGKQEVIARNKAANQGRTVCENCGVQTVSARKSERGVTPPRNETQVDHIYPGSRGGNGSPDNGQVLCRSCNRAKSDKLPE